MIGIEKQSTEIKATAKGGKRPGAGRKAGIRNKATADVRALASVYTEIAIATLADIAQDEGAPAAARIAASNGLLDRGHGKAPQAIVGTGIDGAVLVQVVTGVPRGDDNAPTD